MRVVYVSTRSDTLGGSNVHIRDLAAAMITAGHEAVILGGGDGSWAEDVRGRGIKYVPLRYLGRPIRPYRDAVAVAELRRSVLSERPDVVSLHTAKAGTVGRLALVGSAVPVVYTAHGWTFTDGIPSVEASIYRAVERIVAPLADVIINVCDYERVLALKNGVGRPERHVVIHNGMPDVDVWGLADPEVEPPKLVMVARLDTPKDHSTLIRALATLKHLSWQLELVGDGPLRSRVESAIAKVGIGDRVTLYGERSDVAHILSQAQALVLTTRWEGLPRSVLEGMRAGLPVVVSAVGGVREAVVEGVTGYTVPPGKVEPLAERLASLLSDAGLRLRMGRAAREVYLRRFTFDRMFQETFGVYETVVKGV